MRPEALAVELKISPKTLRQWLRETYPRPASKVNRGWHLTDAQMAAARERFAVPFQRAETREGMVTTTIAIPARLHRRLVDAAGESRSATNEVIREAVGEWLALRDDRTPRTTMHIRLLEYSRRFLSASDDLVKQGGEGWRFPVPQYLAGHAVELALKAHLAHGGASEKTLRDLGHDLEAALERADAKVRDRLDKNHIAAIQMLNPSYSGKQLEYPPEVTGLRRSPPFVLLHGAAQILHIHLDRQFREEHRVRRGGAS